MDGETDGLTGGRDDRDTRDKNRTSASLDRKAPFEYTGNDLVRNTFYRVFPRASAQQRRKWPGAYLLLGKVECGVKMCELLIAMAFADSYHEREQYHTSNSV